MARTLTFEGQSGWPKGSRVPRREFLGGLAGLGVSALIPDALSALRAQGGASGALYRIDVHNHFSAPGFISLIKARNTGQLGLMTWTPSKTLEDMDNFHQSYSDVTHLVRDRLSVCRVRSGE
jgi:hypothetical protein